MSDEQRAASTSPSSVSRLASVSEPAALAATSGARVGVSHETRQAAARARRTADAKRGLATPAWILQLAASTD